MKKIAFFVCSLNIGGSEKACVRMANALAEKNDVTVITMFGGGPLEKELDGRVHVKYFFRGFVRGAARITRMLPPGLMHCLYMRGKYDIEIAVGDGLESHVISGSRNSEKFSWVHMDLRHYGSHYSKRNFRRFSTFKNIICVSGCAREWFLEEFPLAEKAVVAYTPVDTQDIINQADGFCDMPEGTMVAVGRLEKVKGFDRLIEAVAASERSDIRVWIFGDGSEREALRRFISEKGLDGRVVLKGQDLSPYPYIKAARALLCTSLSETFGFTVAEAMLLKTPVLSVKCGGPEEIITAPDEGLICENTVDGIKCGLERIMDGSDGIDTEAAYRRVLSFAVQPCAKAFSDIIGC